MALTYQKERFEDIMAELPALFYAHYAEFEDPDLPLDVDWVKFVALDARGTLHILSAKEDGKLIGYIFTYVQTTTHHAKTLLAATDLIYVTPHLNRGLILRRLINENKKMISDLGAKKLYIIVKADSPTARLLRSMGWKFEEETYSCPL